MKPLAYDDWYEKNEDQLISDYDCEAMVTEHDETVAEWLDRKYKEYKEAYEEWRAEVHSHTYGRFTRIR